MSKYVTVSTTNTWDKKYATVSNTWAIKDTVTLYFTKCTLCSGMIFKKISNFNDVTLVCEDGQQVEVNKVILAASSPFFQKLFRRNKHPHPLIFMRGVNYDDLSAIVDFLYRGRTNVFQESLDSILAIAEDLQLRGLMGKLDEKVENRDAGDEHLPPTSNTQIDPSKAMKEERDNKIARAEGNATVALQSQHSGDLDQLEKMVKSVMEKSENKYANTNCLAHRSKVCGKEGMGSAIKDHIEANHIEGIVIPCNLCEKTFRSRNSLKLHERSNHNQLI